MIFGWGDMVIGNIRRVELVGMGEDFRRLCDFLEFNLGDLIHLLGLFDVALKFLRVGRSCGRVFA